MSDEDVAHSLKLRRFDSAWLSLPVGVVAAGAIVFFAPLPPETVRMLAITVFCVALWIGSPVDPWFTSVIGIGLIGVTFSPGLALIGFRSPATWLIAAGILIGVAARESGLAGLVERLALSRMSGDQPTKARAAFQYLLVALSFGSFALAVVIPSSLVRVLILAPILLSIGDLFTETRTKIGIFLGPLFATFYGATGVLTGSLANIIVTGLVEAGGGPSVTWTEWAVWMGIIMGIARVVLVIIVAYLLYRPPAARTIALPESRGAVSISTSERRMLLFLLVGASIWATDFAHGLHPLFGALVVVLLAFAPQIGVVESAAVEEADFSILFFLGAIFAIAGGLQQTGFADFAAETLLSTLPGDPSLGLVLVTVVVSALVLTLIMEGLAVAGVLTPVLVSFALSAGIPLTPVAMTEAIALTTYFFPYQSAVLIAILGVGFVDSVELTRMATACSLATLGILLPIQIGIFILFF